MIYDTTDVPGYAPSAPYVRNHVQVIGGSNWDLSRSARETPIKKMEDTRVALTQTGNGCDCYVPKPSSINYQPDLVFEFNRNSTELSKGALLRIKQLPKTVKVVVGHADETEKDFKELSKKRAALITRLLKEQGKTVVKAKINAIDIPPIDGHNRRVEIYLD